MKKGKFLLGNLPSLHERNSYTPVRYNIPFVDSTFPANRSSNIVA
jgi:hypothetical protein